MHQFMQAHVGAVDSLAPGPGWVRAAYVPGSSGVWVTDPATGSRYWYVRRRLNFGAGFMGGDQRDEHTQRKNALETAGKVTLGGIALAILTKLVGLW